MTKDSDFLPIEDYFIIGDLRTAALVSKEGSIDWLCLPYFDSPSVFGKLLDQDGGCLALDMPDYKIAAAYVQDSAIVEFSLSRGNARISIKDFMVPKPTKKEVPQQLVRSISGLSGEAELRLKFQPKPKYSGASPAIRANAKELRMPMDNGAAVLILPEGSEAAKRGACYEISISVRAGEEKQLILEYIPGNIKLPSARTGLEKKTAEFWRQWVKKGKYFDFCRSYLVRSAITLKLMQFYPTGAIVAAPTTSLPEEIGGVRNWDYRYSWIRDATFALYAFYVLGYDQEAEQFFDFIEKVTQKCAETEFDIALMYTIWGEPVPKERPLKRLSGYMGSKPVRVGNDAARQFQLDVYGSLIDAFYFASKHGLTGDNKTKWRRLVMQLVRKIDNLWQTADHGIWEARIGTRHYTYSKVMAWVGADRAKRLEQSLGLTSEDMKVCRQLSKSIDEWIWQNSYKPELHNLTQYPKTKAIDATNLLFVLLQFLDKHDPLTKIIIDNTAKELTHDRIFVYRYLKSDGLPGDEGAFVLCSFWLISALAILEDVETALNLFKTLESYMNPQGLLSEEIDPDSKIYLGNYPQTFSHMGYIMSAYYVHKYASRKQIKL
jgi:GH15 family glucan-1,4-alpha-glucosidase